MCSLEFPDIERDIHLPFQDRGLTIVGIATGGFNESEETLDSFMEETGVTFEVVWDQSTYGMYDWPVAPSPFPRQVLIGTDGKITYLASEHRPDDLVAAIEAALP